MTIPPEDFSDDPLPENEDDLAVQILVAGYAVQAQAEKLNRLVRRLTRLVALRLPDRPDYIRTDIPTASVPSGLPCVADVVWDEAESAVRSDGETHCETHECVIPNPEERDEPPASHH